MARYCEDCRGWHGTLPGSMQDGSVRFGDAAIADLMQRPDVAAELQRKQDERAAKAQDDDITW